MVTMIRRKKLNLLDLVYSVTFLLLLVFSHPLLIHYSILVPLSLEIPPILVLVSLLISRRTKALRLEISLTLISPLEVFLVITLLPLIFLQMLRLLKHLLSLVISKRMLLPLVVSLLTLIRKDPMMKEMKVMVKMMMNLNTALKLIPVKLKSNTNITIPTKRSLIRVLLSLEEVKEIF